MQAGLLMVAAADGSVRVWRDYTYRGSQRLATAWQVQSPGNDLCKVCQPLCCHRLSEVTLKCKKLSTETLQAE